MAYLGVILKGSNEHNEFPQLNFSVAEKAQTCKTHVAG
jgi:hypothetical protein